MKKSMEDLTACECPICLLELDGDTRVPVSTPCGHTFCRPCFKGLLTSGRPKPQDSVFCCPFCREWVHAEAVHVNVALRQLIDQIKALKRANHGPSAASATASPSLDQLFGPSLPVLKWDELVLVESLDAGAFGEVHRGSWRGSEVAVKVFHMGQLSVRSMSSFHAELLVMSCMRHPNIVLLMGACRTPRPCIVMEYMRGGSLSLLIHMKKKKLSLENIVMVLQDVSRGLQYLHSINILHRDLKSKNVLLSGDLPCHAKICDFGLAKIRQESATMTGNIGTVHWTAPEVLNNERYHFAADIYSLGMVLVEMVSGEVPFSHMLPVAVVMAVAVRKEKPRLPPDVDHRSRELIDGCIAWQPEDRLTIPQILAKLNEIVPPAKQPLQRQHSDIEQLGSLGVLYISATSSMFSNRGQGEGDKEEGEEEEEAEKVEVEETVDQPLRAQHLELLPNLVVSNSPIEQQQQSAQQQPRRHEFSPEDINVDLMIAQELQSEEESALQRQIENDAYLAQQLQQKDYSYHKPANLTKGPPKVHMSNRPDGAQGQVYDRAKLRKTSRGEMWERQQRGDPLPPPPPPPPPLPPSASSPVRSPLPRRSRPISRSYDTLSTSEIAKLKQIVYMFPRMKLRHVETVEKTVFPVGRVLEGFKLHPYVQQQIQSFNKQGLKHVDPPKRPPPPGRVLSLTDLEEQNYLKPKPKFEGKQYAYYPRLDISPEEDRTPLEQIQPKQPLSRGTKKKSRQPPPPLHPSQGNRGKLVTKGGPRPGPPKFTGPVDAFEFDEFDGSGTFDEEEDFHQQFNDVDFDVASPHLHRGLSNDDERYYANVEYDSGRVAPRKVAAKPKASKSSSHRFPQPVRKSQPLLKGQPEADLAYLADTQSADDSAPPKASNAKRAFFSKRKK